MNIIQTMSFPKIDIEVDSGDYLNDKKKYDAMSWADVTPVDSIGGFVATDKFGKDNLSKTQDNIRDRFCLCGDEEEVS